MSDALVRGIDDARRRWVPDSRLGVFDVALEVDGDGTRAIRGATTSAPARDAVQRLAAEAGLAEEVRLLPCQGAGEHTAAVATTAVAPLLVAPDVRAPRASEVLHGEVLDVLERRDAWLRIRVGDGYHGWVHTGYVKTGTSEWAADWSALATARSLGCEMRCGDERLRLPIGARVALRRDGTVEGSDGRTYALAAGAVHAEEETRAAALKVAPTAWALHWFGGAPYAWGGRTEWGCDCSGLVQAVYAARGVALPRDSDQQVTAGREVHIAPRGRGYETGDLLFFTERDVVSHVALWAGVGKIVHSALSRGGVACDDLFDDAGPVRHLRDRLVAVRRLDG